ncbi:MAG: hypothetical protein JWP85_2761 [Rhodoglobus sp.]|nr:hypothetical protein [Rhodoglobus sp.]
MKTQLLTLAALALASAFGATAQAANFTGTSYTKAYRFEHPLDTYDSCSNHSEAGAEAEEGAENEAMLACQQDYNSDCVVIGRRFRTIMSKEFIGYKSCEAQVTVHGYRMSGRGAEQGTQVMPPESDR